MTDTEVLDAVQRIRTVHKSALTCARRGQLAAKRETLAFFGSPTDDVSRAALHNALRRSEIAAAEKIERADVRRREALAALTAKAGQWAELVPSR